MNENVAPDHTPQAYKNFVRNYFPDRDESFLHYNILRMDYITEFLLEPESHETDLAKMLKLMGITLAEYNLLDKYYQAKKNVHDEVEFYNNYVLEHGLDFPLLEVAFNKSTTESYFYESLESKRENPDDYCKLKVYKVVERSDE